MFTQNGFKAKISALLDVTNHDDTVADILQDITDERGEVDEVIRRHAVNYPDDGDSFEFQNDEEDWKSKYNDLKDKYNSRFFRHPDPETTVIPDVSSPLATVNGMDEADKDLERNEEKQIDDLFK